ncbi:MAG: FKBP-type peptidyl-prolyl cis-trans isomerase [Flavobacteriales bacterium]
MKKIYLLLPILTFLFILSCKKDDNSLTVVPVRDRGEESINAQERIEDFLSTHFYNYEEFENPPADFDYVIKFDSLINENSNKIPLIDMVEYKTVQDRIDEDVTYKLYYLNVRQGEGDIIHFPDVVRLSYEGRFLDNELFDGAVQPVQFDLVNSIDGFQDGLTGFNVSTNLIVNDDGTFDFENYGIGAVFVPTGLAYFSAPPTGSPIPVYSDLIFTFKVFQVETGDQDGDGVISIMEDRNGNGIEEDDDTDGDNTPDIIDVDDDGDGRLTKDEIIENVYTVLVGEQEPILAENEVETGRQNIYDENDILISVEITTITLTDEDGDGTPDYLDSDS